MRVLWPSALLVSLLGLAVPAVGQMDASAESAIAEPANQYQIPQSPAFTLLGMSPTKIATPASLHDLSVDLLNGLDASGAIVQGFALEVGPAEVTRTFPTLREYQDSFAKRSWYNTRVSIGTKKADGGVESDDIGATDICIGVRTSLFDGSDPLRDPQFTQEIATILNDALEELPPGASDADRITIQDRATKKYSQLGQKWSREHWNASRVELAVASAWAAKASVLKNTQFAGFGSWITCSLPVGSWVQILGQLELRGTRLPKESGQLSTDVTIQGGGRLNIGSARVNGFAEVVLGHPPDESDGSDSEEPLDEPDGSSSFGIEYRIADGVWLTTGIGQEFGTGDAEPSTIIAGLRWGMASKARLDPRA